MREIKFRVWDKVNNRMIKSELILGIRFDRRDTKPILITYTTKIFPATKELLFHDKVFCNEFEIMQYTGLKDKNGVEIYEGDILSTDLSRPYLIVEFRNGAFMFQCHDNGKDYYDFMTSVDENSNFTKYHKVIDNVYEHPELLEVKE